MAGLLQQKPQQPPNAGAGASDRFSNEGDEPNVSPEEQQQYYVFVTNGMKILDDQKALPKILEAIKGDGSPVEGLGNALAMLVMRLEDSAAQQGQKIDGELMLEGGTELLEQMVELAEAAGVHEFTKKEMESALYLAMDIYRASRQESGQLDEEALDADWQELMRADEAGELEQLIPGIGEYAKGLPQPDQKPTKRGG